MQTNWPAACHKTRLQFRLTSTSTLPKLVIHLPKAFLPVRMPSGTFAMRHSVWLLFYILLCLHAQAAEKLRTWTNTQGRTIRAEFLREVDGDATFLKDGKLITIPLEQLCDEDRKVIRELASAKPANDEPRAEGPANIRPAAPPVAPPSSDDRALAAAKKKISMAERVWTNQQGNQTTAK